MPKKKFGKRAIFGPKPWVNPFGKMSVFLLLELFCFYRLQRRFVEWMNRKDVEYRNRYFIGLYCLKKNWEKGPFLDQNHWLTPLEKFQFFDCLNFFFL